MVIDEWILRKDWKMKYAFTSSSQPEESDTLQGRKFILQNSQYFPPAQSQEVFAGETGGSSKAEFAKSRFGGTLDKLHHPFCPPSTLQGMMEDQFLQIAPAIDEAWFINIIQVQMPGIQFIKRYCFIIGHEVNMEEFHRECCLGNEVENNGDCIGGAKTSPLARKFSSMAEGFETDYERLAVIQLGEGIR
ncbi:hypothetical protein EYZ11_005704 [Aspergillus tanneri]|uniref:Uncharacterized protein n=1 Tax=Aspergillus tanneri TaxID=1220188 RepID=A0A4S3JHM4_9EURO|nr:hypothetical protein EYZ11_005704 [Aspergillus tanneri]